MSAKTIIQPNQPDVLVFENGGGAVKITAFGLVGNDCLKFKRVVQDAQRKTFESGGCAVYAPTPSEIALSAPYQVGNCEPTIHAQRNTIFIAEAGRFLPVLQGDESVGSLLVQVESVPVREFSGAELGIDPCGCPCTDSTWTWTGNERYNGENVEREYVSECGTKEWRVERLIEWWETGVTRCRDFRVENQEQSEHGKIRWVRTETVCGVSPSVPLVLSDECCNDFVGYVFHPNEPRDPAATVELIDCDTRIVGYAYPAAGAGHTLAIKDCDGQIYGYAANNSVYSVAFKPCGVGACDDVAEIELNIPRILIETICVPDEIEYIWDNNGTIIGTNLIKPGYCDTKITQS